MNQQQIDLEHAKERCSQLEKEIAAIKKQCIGHCDEYARIKTDVEQKDAKIVQQQNDNEALNKKVVQMTKDNDSQRAEITAKDQEIKRLTTKENKLPEQPELTMNQEMVEAYETELRLLRVELRDTQMELALANDRCETLQANKELIRNKVLDQNRQFIDLQQAYKRLSSQRIEERQQLDSLFEVDKQLNQQTSMLKMAILRFVKKKRQQIRDLRAGNYEKDKVEILKSLLEAQMQIAGLEEQK